MIDQNIDAADMDAEDDHYPNDDGCLDHGDPDCTRCTADEW